MASNVRNNSSGERYEQRIDAGESETGLTSDNGRLEFEYCPLTWLAAQITLSLDWIRGLSQIWKRYGPRDQFYARFASVSFFRIDCVPVLWLAA